jgi:uncharacterized protein YkwD
MGTTKKGTLESIGFVSVGVLLALLFVGSATTQTAYATIGNQLDRDSNRDVIQPQQFLVMNSRISAAGIFDLANKSRTDAGLPRFLLNQTLVASAQSKASDMASKGYFSHNSPDGKTPWYWFDQTGYHFLNAGENLAVNFTDSFDVDRAWMNSPTHRANILKAEFSEIGIALSTGYYQGRLTTFVVEHFGRPAFNFAPIAVVSHPLPTSLSRGR